MGFSEKIRRSSGQLLRSMMPFKTRSVAPPRAQRLASDITIEEKTKEKKTEWGWIVSHKGELNGKRRSRDER